MSVCTPRFAASSALALATALAAGPAHGQSASPSFNAVSVTLGSGSVGFDRGVTTPGTDVYTVNSPTAVIDFVPSDTATGGGTINFQNAGTTSIFQSSPGGPAFTVLNRIVPADPSRAIAFNGAVVANLRNAAGVGTRGGSVWFYSPGGIVIGSGAAFDVGNLLLSTGDPTGGSGTITNTSQFTLTSNANDAGIVDVRSGATLNATNAGSYIALVAPTVLQTGRVNINGSAAYVAAERATLTLNQGLFDISVQIGSNATNGFSLQHAGTTRFTNVATPSRAYLVALPKNDAISLVIASTADIGFDIATTAGIENGRIVLSSGYASVTQTPTIDNGFSSPGAFTSDMGFQGGGTFNADVVGRTRDNAFLIANADTLFGNDVGLRAGVLAQANGDGAGHTLTIRGDLRLSAQTDTISTAAAATAGRALLLATNGGATVIGGDALVIADANGILSAPGATGAATGGEATIDADTGNITIGGTASASAGGFSATSGTGGVANVLVSAGRTLSVGALTVAASGSGLSENAAIGTTSGGAGTGGFANIRAAGTLQIAQGVYIDTQGAGGAQTGTGAGSGGAGQGGTSRVETLAGGTLTAGNTVTIVTRGSGGNAANGSGGDGRGGNGQFANAGAAALPSLDFNASGVGGNKTGGTSGTAGAGTAGSAQTNVIGGTLTIQNGLTASAIGTGGALSSAAAIAAGVGTGANGTGGTALASIDNGALNVGGAITLSAAGGGGTGSSGGAGVGGIARIIANAGGGTIAANGVNVSATASGATANGPAGTAGAATGGQAQIQLLATSAAATTTASLGAITLTGDANTGTGIGGASVGGQATIQTGAGTTLTAGATIITAAGRGSSLPGNGNAGAGQGGSANAGVGGVATIASLVIGASGDGGEKLGGSGNAAGGQSGNALLQAIGGGVLTVTGQTRVTANGTGGRVINGAVGSGGGGTAADARIVASGAGSRLNLANVTLDSTGNGGAGQGTGGNGGNGTASTASISQGTGGTVAIGGDVFMFASGAGAPGPAGNGGVGRGGDARLVSNDGAVTVAGQVQLNAQAFGQSGLTGGGATGGVTNIGANTGLTRVDGAVVLNAQATGGAATSCNGGDGTAGQAIVGSIGTGTIMLGSTATLIASGTGGATSGAGTAGRGSGGTSQIFATRGAVRLTGAASLNSDGMGGQSLNATGGGPSGQGNGGFASVTADGGVIALSSTASLTASGRGGTTQTSAGAGIGGTAQVSTAPGTGGGGGTINVAGLTTLNAAALGGAMANAASGGSGGFATGGTVSIFAQTGSLTFGGISATNPSTASVGANGSVASARGVNASVNATGGDITVNGLVALTTTANAGPLALTAAPRDGGDATGGAVFLGAAAGRTLTITGQTVLGATAVGGGNNGGGDRIGGTGTGGAVTVDAAGTINLASLDTGVVANGGASVGAGGAGIAGFINVGASTGVLRIAGALTMNANGIGGGSLATGIASNGGDGAGGGARLSANVVGGVVTVGGAATISANGTGGAGGTAGGDGGAGFGGTSTDFTRQAVISAQGGNVTLTSQIDIRTDGTGGAAFGSGNAGAGAGGLTRLVARNGALVATSGGTIIASAAGVGGAAAAIVNLTTGAVTSGGGRGGSGTGGNASAIASTSATAATEIGRITLNNLQMDARGAGGAGAAGGTGQAGGAGGAGAGGGAQATAQTGNGILVANVVTALTDGVGGVGGRGGIAGTVAGAPVGPDAGGAGGAGTGGAVNTGTVSQPDSSFALGSARFATLNISAIGRGGAGGASSAGATPGGGGTGTGGGGFLLSRGAPTIAGAVNSNVSGTGGAGGLAGATVTGAAGAGVGGQAEVAVTNRFNGVERGSMTLASYTSTASGNSPSGGATTAGVSRLTVSNGDATIGSATFGSVTLTANGASPPPAALGTSGVSVTGGTLALPDFFFADVTGNIGVLVASNGLLTLDSAFLQATGSLLLTDGAITTDFDNIDVASNLGISTGNDLTIDQDIEIGGDLFLSSGGNLTTANITAGNFIDLIAGNGVTAPRNVRTGALRVTNTDSFEGSGVEIEAQGTIDIASITGGYVEIELDEDDDNGLLTPQGDLTIGTIRATDSVAIRRNGRVTLGDVTLTRSADFDPEDLEQAPGVLVDAAGDVRVGNITSPLLIGLASRTGGVTAGALTGDASIALFAATTVNTGALTGGRGARDTIFVSNASIVATDPAFQSGAGDDEGDNEQPFFYRDGGDDEDDDHLPIDYAAITPVRLGGALTVNGAVSTGNFLVSANSVSTRAIDAATRIAIDSGTTIATADITTPAALALTSDGNVATGAVSAASIALTSRTGAIASGALTAGTTVALNAAGNVTTGAIRSGATTAIVAGGAATIGGVVASRLTLDARGLISIGAVTTTGDTLLTAAGARIAATGPIVAGGGIALLADTGFATGALTASRGTDGFIYLAAASNRSRIADGNLTAAFAAGDATAAAAPVAIGGAISTGLLRVASTGANSYAGIEAGQAIRILAGSATFTASAAAPTIDLSSTDIALAQGVTFGGTATQSLTLTARSGAPVLIGGVATDQAQGAYLLDAAEATRLRAGVITITQQGFPSGDAQLILRDLTLTGSADTTPNLTSATGALTIASPGSIRVTGNVRLNGMAAGNALILNAGEDFDLVTDAGSLGLFGTGDALGGRLAINAAGGITVANARLFALGDATDFDDADPATVIAAVGAPSGQNRPEGFVQANRLELAARDFIVIQNSGTAATAGGFTAGAGGMRVAGTSTQQTTGGTTGSGLALIAYGRVQRDDGSFATNNDTRSLITFAGPRSESDPLTGFAPFSVVNGCALTAGSACGGGVLPPAQQEAVVTIGTDVQGVVDGALSAETDGESVGSIPDVRLQTVIDQAALTTDSIINEPVASGGNASLWESGEGAASDDEDDDRRRRRIPAAKEGRP